TNIVHVSRGDHRQPLLQRMQLDSSGAGVAQPKAVALVGNDQVKSAVGRRLEMRQGVCRGGGVRVVEGLEGELATRAPIRCRAECGGVAGRRARGGWTAGGATPKWWTRSEARRGGRWCPPMTSGRSGQWRPGGCHGRSIISSRLAPISTGQE